MTKTATLTTIGSGYASGATLDNNFEALNTALENTLSRDGSTPNQMEADLDMDSNDILNVKDISVTGTFTLNGSDVSDALFSGVGSGTVFNTTNRFSGTGSTTVFTLSKSPVSRANTQVFINGVYQQKDTYTVSSTTLTFTQAPPLGTDNIEVNIQESTDAGTLTADSVATSDGEDVQAKLDALNINKASYYGAVGDGTTLNDSVVFPEGIELDFEGGIYTFTSTPTFYCTAFNGSIKVGSTYTPLPKVAPKHPLDGNFEIAKEASGVDYHPGPVWHYAAENRLFRVYAEVHQHRPALGASVYSEYSDDGGNTWAGKVTLYSDATLAPSAMVGGLMGSGRFGVIICTDDNPDTPASATRTLEFIYSDDNGDTWSAPATIPDAAGITKHFAYGELYPYPAAAGGHDTTGFIFYTYTNNIVYSHRTSDNGANWTTAVFYDGASAGKTVNETVIARVNDETKWVGYIRGEDPLLAFVSTNMTTPTVVASNIQNGGSTGDPPYLLNEFGRMWLYLPRRENWTEDEARAQQLQYYTADASALYDAGGVFPDPTGHIAANIPSRAIGMIASTATPFGRFAQLRCGEDVYPTSSANAATSMLAQISRVPTARPSVAHVRTISPNPNLIQNPTFDAWHPDYAVGVPVTGLSSNEYFAYGWRLYCNGATFSVTKELVDEDLAVNLPFRPAYGARLTTSSSGAASSGFEQLIYGENFMRHAADRVLTLQLYMAGSFPSGDTARFLVTYAYDGSTATDVADIRYIENSTGVWIAEARVRTPTAVGATFGANPYISLRIDCGTGTTSDWDALVLGVKVEFGKAATPLLSPNNLEAITHSSGKEKVAMYAKALTLANSEAYLYLRDDDGDAATNMSAALRIQDTTAADAAVVGFVGTASGLFQVKNTKGNLYLEADANNAASSSFMLFRVDGTERARINPTGLGVNLSAAPTEALDVNGDAIRIRTSQTPASAAATGTAGMVCWDTNYVYVCVATDTWKRAALSTW